MVYILLLPICGLQKSHVSSVIEILATL